MDTALTLLADLFVKSTLLLALAGLASLLLRRASAAARHLHWQITLAGLLALPLLAPTLPALHVPLPQPLLAAAPWLAPAAPPSASPAPALRTPSRVAPPAAVGASLEPVTAGLLRPDVARWSAAPLKARSAAAGHAGAAAHGATSAASRGDSTGRWVLAAWAGGAALVLGVLLIGLLRAASLARAARPLVDADWMSLSDRVRGELGMRRRVRLLVAGRPVVPMTWGFLSPVVLLPSDAHAWTPPRRRHVLLHELAHVQRGDWLTQLLAQIVCALYWFQPLAWLAARALRRERERACDDQVLLAGGKASEYAGHLLEIARTRAPGFSGSSAALAMARRSQLEGRLLAVLDERRDRRLVATRRATLAALLAAAIVVPLACMHPKAEPNEAAPSDVPAGEARPRTPNPEQAPTAESHLRTPNPDLAPMAPMPRQPGPAPHDIPPIPRVPPMPPMPRMPVPQVAPEPGEAPDEFDLAEYAEAPEAFEYDEATWDQDWKEASAAYAFAFDQDEDGSIFSFHFSAGDEEMSRWTWPADAGQMTVECTGSVAFSDDDRGVAAIDDDSSLTIELKGQGGLTRIEVLRGQDGEPHLLGKVADRDASEPELREALAGLVLPIERHTGLGAEERIERIADHEGVPGVLAEIGRLTGDSARLRYARALPEQRELTTAELGQLLTLMATSIESDPAMAELLCDDSSRWLSDPALHESLVQAVVSIDSDPYEAQVLEELLDAETLQPAAAAALLHAAATGIESDPYLAEVLSRVNPVMLRESAVASAWFEGAVMLESDPYQAETLEGLLSREGLSDELRMLALQTAAAGLESDAYMADLLQSVDDRALQPPIVRDAFLAAIARIESDAYVADVINDRLDDRADPAFIAALIGVGAACIESDAYMAGVLNEVPPGLLHEPGVRKAFGMAADSIASPSYHEQVIELLPPGSEPV